MKYNFNAIGSYVVAKRLAAETETAGGIILPESKNTVVEAGNVVSVGDKITHISVGDKILIPQHSGRTINIEDEEFVILTEEEVMVRFVS